jgi:hypothetical protein
MQPAVRGFGSNLCPKTPPPRGRRLRRVGPLLERQCSEFGFPLVAAASIFRSAGIEMRGSGVPREGMPRAKPSLLLLLSLCEFRIRSRETEAYGQRLALSSHPAARA